MTLSTTKWITDVVDDILKTQIKTPASKSLTIYNMFVCVCIVSVAQINKVCVTQLLSFQNTKHIFNQNVFLGLVPFVRVKPS